ncbi:ovomucoid-like [Physella acuta]|uniref:ovomucoid-like n=1 Tax=Physella acuta TaxID=109671 RepID=UPI0027DABEC1|nr:ovomucoid-like [Physella acuta]
MYYFTVVANVLGCLKPCTKLYKPICGSDGKTYGNQCELDNANCLNGGRINALFEGDCIKGCYKGDANRTCPVKGCPRLLNPVCGSDNNTYNNDCLLDAANCDLPADKKITAKSCGRCSYTCTKPCPFLWAPVCASDDLTYANMCELGNANCGRSDGQKLTVVDCIRKCRKVDVPRPCPVVGCGRDLNPVCGSDGRTYNNDCLLDAANCGLPAARKVKVKSCGKCA